MDDNTNIQKHIMPAPSDINGDNNYLAHSASSVLSGYYSASL